MIHNYTNDTEVLIRVHGISKKFCRDLKKSLWYGMKDVASELLPFARNTSTDEKEGSGDAADVALNAPQAGLRPGEFWANKDITFQLRRGESLGLIGHNGAGKTTLLKMLNGLIMPDKGSIEIRGRVGALIALGAGFNPILTGRENIYINASILGLDKREIDAKMEEIIDFSEISDFIDSPLQSYSSGMQVRLGFAVATATTPDLLLVDEVLAVGDLSFRQKCYQKIKSYRESGGSVILVSHDMHAIQSNTDQCLFLNHGALEFLGSTQEAIQHYFTSQLQSWEKQSAGANRADSPSGSFRIHHFEMNSATGGAVHPSSTVEFSAELENPDQEVEVFWGILIWNRERSQRITTLVSHWTHIHQPFPSGRRKIRFTVHDLPLAPGTYSVDFCLWNHDTLYPLADSWNEGCSRVLAVLPKDEIDNRQVTNDDIISAKFLSVDWGGIRSE
jgi:ABC-type polysaccharide/polyol phosphate transport system ATPase subunit